MQKLQSSYNVQPIRNLNDFVTAAKFSIPKSREKWISRLYDNLIYYQTNYFMEYLVLFTLITIIEPKKMMCGFTMIGFLYGIFTYVIRERLIAAKLEEINPRITLLLILGALYLTALAIQAIFVLLGAFTLPAGVVIVHASLREREMTREGDGLAENLKNNPMSSLLEKVGMRRAASQPISADKN